MEDADTIHVEVVYALPTEQPILTLDVPEGTTMAQAILQSGILDRFPEIDRSHVEGGHLHAGIVQGHAALFQA